MNILEQILQQQIPEPIGGQCDHFNWQWLGEGLLSFTPIAGYEKVIVLSAGIHGNETAPIELLDQICRDIFTGNLNLKVRLLLVLGNPLAIRHGSRYLENDINRMFCGKYLQLDNLEETQRAKELENVVKQFFEQSNVLLPRYHYDLHTAIRSSLLSIFALLPYQKGSYDTLLLNSLAAAEMDAVVYHSEVGNTFTSFTSAACKAASVTLELGVAKPLGQNDLTQFMAIDHVLRAMVSAAEVPFRQKDQVRVFKVVNSVIKQDDDFLLNLSADAPNFSSFQQGELIASQSSGNYVAKKDDTRILFPNIHVKKGLRAGLVLEEIENK